MTTNERYIAAEKYNKTFKGLHKSLKVTAFLDDVMLPLPVSRIFKPLYPVELTLRKIGEKKINDFEKFKNSCAEEDRKMEELRKEAISID